VLLHLAAAFMVTFGDGLPSRSPGAVGMSAARLAKIDHVVARGISAGGYPGAAVVVGRKGYAVWEKGFGKLGWGESSAWVVPDRTIYDLASLTKVVATTTALMILYDEGRIRLDDPAWRYVAGFSGGAKDRVTIRQLLTHRAGLPAGRDLWRIARTPAEARQAVIDTKLEWAPGTHYEYSDIGADLLGFIAEAAANEPLDRFLQRRVYGPLGMTDTEFRPSASLRDRIAPTEVTPPRGYPLQGEVHDENAFALGGVAGHAGLFSTATDLSIFAQMLLNGGSYNGVRIVSEPTVQLFTKRAAGSRALGWDTCNQKGSCGDYLSESAFGHTGFTGTSLWIDPEREMFVVLLTNRVHAARARRPAKVIADVRADLADAAALAVTDYGDGLLDMPRAFRADRAEGWNKVTPQRTRRASSRSRRSSAKSTARKASAKSSRSAKASAGSTAKASGSKKSASKASSAKAKRATGSKANAASKAGSRKAGAGKASAGKGTATKGVSKRPVAKKRAK
jgi:CubicO group peptidase (beta-lactamase class C family)